ncbi:FAD-dependent oxidoreductase [Maritimibacter sp. UBA3975]|mgnify:CR=1 FL=1|uniref:NAD(P)/FAD-dependent oxidoreductase n=1 Tax=Maritimibacter sp. UBA3975 TaxID=1946833 RepID=UPI0025BC682C|nr:FAD-dependent oxidoreductase [Maritimibacter sp. UBA3975]|tara:strand:- start:29902 stop:31125 length:1224 start_codon:yes stop_codon:yes gene_type:complete
MTELRHIAIVGASLAGARAAEGLRKQGFEGRITMFGEEPWRPYERPTLSKTALLNEGEEPVWVHPATYYAEAGIDLRAGRAVERLERLDEGFRLFVGDEGVQADKVLLATGAAVRRLAGTENLTRVHYLRDWRDTQTLGNALRKSERVIVVGSGFIGAEIAATASKLCNEVILIEACPDLFPTVGSLAIREALRAAHARAGVSFRTGVACTAFEETSHGVSVSLDDGSRVSGDIAVVGIGVAARDDLARQAGAETDSGVVVNANFQSNVPGLYAAGDVAVTRGPDGQLTRTGHWRAAQEQGAAAAAAMLGLEIPQLSLPWHWSDQYEHRLDAYGDCLSADKSVLRREENGGLTEFHLSDGKLVGITGLDTARVFRPAVKWIGQDVWPNAEDLANPAIPIKKISLEVA